MMHHARHDGFNTGEFAFIQTDASETCKDFRDDVVNSKRSLVRCIGTCYNFTHPSLSPQKGGENLFKVASHKLLQR